MWDRYTMAFAAEQRAFAEAVINGTETQVTGEDGPDYYRYIRFERVEHSR